MRKIIQNIALIVIALIFGWLFLIPPYLDVTFEGESAQIVCNYFEQHPAELSSIEIMDIRDSLIWKATAIERSFEIETLTLVLGSNHKSLGIPKEFQSQMHIVAAQGDSCVVQPGQFLRVVIKKPGSLRTWFKNVQSAELEFETASYKKR